jgi:Prenylcysteine lyase
MLRLGIKKIREKILLHLFASHSRNVKLFWCGVPLYREMRLLQQQVALAFYAATVSLSTVSLSSAKKIAVIGGGISGTFVTKYLVDHDPECKLESITIFESQPVNGTVRKEDDSSATSATSATSAEYQHSRVWSLELDDGAVVELGASILYKGFYLVLDMIRAGGLELGEPFNTGKELDPDESALRTGMGIYTGNGTWALVSAGLSDTYQKLQLMLRYNRDLVTLSQICQQAQKKFAQLPAMFASTRPEYFFDSPDDIWDALGLTNAVHNSYDDFLNVIGVSKTISWWRRVLPYQGNLRAELLTAINLVNYNQDNANVNGVVGLGSFAATAGGSLYSVKGGNYQIIRSALQQAIDNRKAHCQKDGTVTQVLQRVTSVVGDLEGLTLFSGQEELGEFDIVILAAPLQQAQIQFLIQSQVDKAVIQPMPMGGLIDAHNTEAPDDGHSLLPANVPDCAARPYTQVVTTVVRNVVLFNETFPMANASDLPRSILMTVSGKASTYNITAITQIRSKGSVFKVFSNNPLSTATLRELFGAACTTDYVKIWGGPHGGATPDYKGEGGRTKFLLYDGAVGFKGHTSSGALYYPVAMEQSSLASMETAAVGARAVAKLVAERVGLLERREDVEVHDEL